MIFYHFQSSFKQQLQQFTDKKSNSVYYVLTYLIHTKQFKSSMIFSIFRSVDWMSNMALV